MEFAPYKILRFKITLLGSQPEIWRIIDIPDDYNFWELHVAIQDAMGWLDYHLHEFVPNKKGPTQGRRIGIPESESDTDVVADWDVSVKKYFSTLGNTIQYDYDFGDGWQHEVQLIGMFLADITDDYPICCDGKGACPPEDCGGLPGYYDLIQILGDPKNEEYDAMVEWLKGHAKKYWPYKPDSFNPKKVKFTDPYERWKMAFNVADE